MVVVVVVVAVVAGGGCGTTASNDGLHRWYVETRSTVSDDTGCGDEEEIK